MHVGVGGMWGRDCGGIYDDLLDIPGMWFVWTLRGLLFSFFWLFCLYWGSSLVRVVS